METQTIQPTEPSQRDPAVIKPDLELDQDRALPSTGSDQQDVMTYASDLYKALQLSRRREAELQQQLGQAKTVSQEMGSASLHQYKELADQTLEKARLLKKSALEAGNPEDILKADEEYMKALAAKNWSEHLIRQKDASVSSKKEQNPQGEEGDNNRSSVPSLDPRAEAFVKAHGMIDPLSASYDPQKHQEVATYAMALEMNLNNEGRGHEICSPAYFKKIEEYMVARFGKEIHGAQKSASQKPTVRPLSPDEQRLCKIMNIKEEEYLKHREDCAQEYKARQEAGERYA